MQEEDTQRGTALGQSSARLEPWREELALQHLPLVSAIAKSTAKKIPYSFPLDDLIGAGPIGLLEAAKIYDSEQKTTFRIPAAMRIRGAIWDELRQFDFLDHRMRREANRIRNAHKRDIDENGEPITTLEQK